MKVREIDPIRGRKADPKFMRIKKDKEKTKTKAKPKGFENPVTDLGLDSETFAKIKGDSNG